MAKVISIRELGSEDVYNMEVETHHNFSVNGGLIVHNCFDSLGYGLIAWHAKRSTAPAPEKSEIQRDKEQLAKRRGKRNIRKLT